MKAEIKDKKFAKLNQAALDALKTGYKKLTEADPYHLYTKRAKTILDIYKIRVRRTFSEHQLTGNGPRIARVILAPEYSQRQSAHQGQNKYRLTRCH